MNILGIESSCDETSLALLKAKADGFELKRHVVSSQATIHEAFGGVVPEVAARQHTENIIPLLEQKIGREKIDSADMIAVTEGPGLITSLMIGVEVARTLSWYLQKPLLGVNHLEAHIYANWLSHPEIFKRHIFPALVLIISGGHSLIVLMRDHNTYEQLGQTVDDAAGESFDKVAKLLELGYPGGPEISKLAEQGDPKAIDFPRPMSDGGYDMSFSGLKTAVLYYLRKQGRVKKSDFPDIAASFQQAVIDILISRAQRAVEEFMPASVMLVGGVSANRQLKNELQKVGDEHSVPVYVPGIEFTGDNAAMIAAAAYFKKDTASLDAWKSITPKAQYSFL